MIKIKNLEVLYNGAWKKFTHIDENETNEDLYELKINFHSYIFRGLSKVLVSNIKRKAVNRLISGDKIIINGKEEKIDKINKINDSYKFYDVLCQNKIGRFEGKGFYFDNEWMFYINQIITEKIKFRNKKNEFTLEEILNFN